MSISTRRQSTPAPAGERWDPFRELEQLATRTRQLMESGWAGFDLGDSGSWIPAVDVEETDDAWVVEAELPGVRRDDVDIELHRNELTISGEVKERERSGVLRRRTRRTGRFEYRVDLPGETDAERAEASMDDGVLRLRLPKSEPSEGRRIEVRSSSSG